MHMTHQIHSFSTSLLTLTSYEVVNYEVDFYTSSVVEQNGKMACPPYEVITYFVLCSPTVMQSVKIKITCK